MITFAISTELLHAQNDRCSAIPATRLIKLNCICVFGHTSVTEFKKRDIMCGYNKTASVSKLTPNLCILIKIIWSALNVSQGSHCLQFLQYFLLLLGLSVLLLQQHLLSPPYCVQLQNYPCYLSFHHPFPSTWNSL